MRWRWGAAEWIGVMVGTLGVVELYGGAFWGLHRLADWLSADPARWLIAAALVFGWAVAWAVIGLVGSLLAALTHRVFPARAGMN